MCYVIITGGSLVWFVLSLVADMLIASAIVTPKWLIGPNPAFVSVGSSISSRVTSSSIQNETQLMLPIPTVRYPSVGIYTRCKMMHGYGYHCGPFDLDGFATDSNVYPSAWKATMFFMSLGFAVHSITVALTLVTCCRQSAFGKSIHNMTGCAQVVSAISIMLALFLHPLAWGAPRVQLLCGADAEPFYPAGCSIGISFYCAVAAAVLCFICAGISLKAESSNMRMRVKRRVEEGNRLVCIP
ncbi:LHFPL tetraspan subfamily member 2a protein [Bactrocera neohumeralis]|uniref:LHFPL tetraspan subfamily member 2a protein n=1 Tax=Bactrocera tryoni TaxID=59916 RepID=UPI001A963EA9|nr:LHFPL tetraspan subfamily member 2a protein [Bactrocera tryoni]XP_039953715.1 LHFPL tetraspan subfamily member 2a protein [Bactrocera tryoni]XP_039953716.1 LHFPL tetraspan subfamily member 2a protein [Bactrocera tryoni]XP_050322963.1 LHFPL tetraspan subfamily member 2a protein [Bactrocera neohumeralis]XP_050322964.1 LHFPL tetraspan subfamily member 2a protein [Bactrocera neohumeralis]XP_050322965.1 LHFPL tetraspan subfamily member 2a protein [Bactrocera neohumeralis]XP_050322966.1 LHFPL te